jgi:IPT/TIG domain
MHSRRWLIAAVVAWALGSACSQYNTNLSIQTSSSTLFFLGPQTATAGGKDFTITARGTGFVTGAFILWNGSQLSDTTFVSSTTLTATVPASDIATPGTVPVSVQVPGSAVSGTSSTSASTTTEVSNIVNFTINPAPGPLPVISSISASTTSMTSTPACSSSGFTLSVGGTNFTNDSVVNWNGPARATSFVSSTQLTALILATDAAFPGTAGVSVSTASGASNTMPFTLTTPTSLPAPIIGSLSQTTVVAGSQTFTLTVNGTSFVPCSVVQFGAVAEKTTYVGATQLDAIIPAADIFAAGTGGTPRNVNVNVFTLTPGGTSAPIVFTITP